MNLIDSRSPKVDRRLNFLIVISSLSVGALLILTPAALATRDSTVASARTDELAACRGQFRALVDSANVEVTVATSKVQAAIAAGLVAIVHEDDRSLAAAVEQAGTGRVETLAAVGQLAEAVAGYSTAVTEAQEDPEGFLAECRSNP